MAKKKDPNREVVTEAQAGVQRDENAADELRVGLATGSNASNPDQPDGHVIQSTVVPSSPEEPTTADLSVAVTPDGKDGPAAG